MNTIENPFRLSDSFRELLLEINTPLARAVIRKERYALSHQRFAIIQDLHPISIGYAFKFRAPAQVAFLAKRLRRYSPKREIGTCFTFREKAGLISYMPAGRMQYHNPDGSWRREGRQEIKPGKWIRAVLPEKMIRRLGGDPAVAQFAARFNAFERGEGFTFEPSSWDAIYSPSYFGGDKGDVENYVGGSCMWGKPVSSFYSNVGSCVPYVVKREGKPVGRFIFWPEVRRGGHVISLVDRIYCKPSVLEATLKWARESGHYVKAAQSTGIRTAIGPDGNDLNLSGYSVEVKAPFSPGDVFCPYVDTFQNGSECDGEITSLYCGSLHEGDYSFCHTDGEFDGGPDSHEGEVQDVDGEWIDKDEAIMVGDDYYHQDDERIVYCDNGSHEGHHILREDAFAVELGGCIGTVYVHEDDVSRA